MLSKILVAVDQSTASQQAFETALKLAKALGAHLTLVHVLDVFDPVSPERPTIPVNSYGMGLDDTLRKNYDRQWTEFVDHYASLLKQKQENAEAIGVTADYVHPYGLPGPTICKVAETTQSDLIIVGSHGRSGLKELILGSVSNYIMHHAPCSIMVIHPNGRHAHVSLEENSAISATALS